MNICVCVNVNASNNYGCQSTHMCDILCLSGRELKSGESTRENTGLKERSGVRQMHKVNVNRSLLREGHLCIVC